MYLYQGIEPQRTMATRKVTVDTSYGRERAQTRVDVAVDSTQRVQ